MAIGMVYGHAQIIVDQRRSAIITIMGLADGAAVGVSGLAARAGAKGGARVLQRIPSTPAPATAPACHRALSRLGATKGPWSLTVLIPYGIGAGVGAAGNALAGPHRGTGREGVLRRPLPHRGAAGPRSAPEVVEVLDDETELLEPEAAQRRSRRPGAVGQPNVPGADDDIVDAEIVD